LYDVGNKICFSKYLSQNVFLAVEGRKMVSKIYLVGWLFDSRHWGGGMGEGSSQGFHPRGFILGALIPGVLIPGALIPTGFNPKAIHSRRFHYRMNHPRMKPPRMKTQERTAPFTIFEQNNHKIGSQMFTHENRLLFIDDFSLALTEEN